MVPPKDIIAVEPATGTSEVLVRADDLKPKYAKTPLAISACSWSQDWSRLLIFTSTQRAWRQNTRGDYWVYDLRNKELRKLGGNHRKPR